MKQYYEAEVLFQLMEREGFNIPSSVPKYESEIKAYLINQVKQAYPKLTDYEAEWLLYNYTKHLPAEFPISSVTNATSATFENVVPFAYQNAILKGSTLINLAGEKRGYNDNGAKLYGWEFMLPYNLTSGKTYLAVFNATGTISDTNSKVYLMDNNFQSTTGNTDYPVDFKAGYNMVKCVASGDNHRVLRIRTKVETSVDFEVSDVMLIEYQDGMENWGIPYFEGMQSVKVPVLKTTRKNLFDKDSVTMDYVVGSDGKIIESIGNGITDFIKVSKGKTYVKSDASSSLSLYSSSKTFIKRVNSTNTYTSTVDGYIRWNIATIKDVIDTLQIEESSTTTSYEPFKSNILTVNEDVTLRSNGNVYDELDLLTGKLTQRFGEIVFNGSENWEMDTVKTNTCVFRLNIKDMKSLQNHVICDHLPTSKDGDVEKISNGIKGGNGTPLYIALLKTKASNVNELKSYLSQNPLTVQYQLEAKSIKTVDLTIVDEKGESTHFMPLEGTMNVQSSGEIIKPTFDLSVPVEATTQNLASFIDLEMEE